MNIPRHQLSEADGALRRASVTLGRKLPAADTYIRKLLQRNWFIVKDVEAVFAIGEFERDGKVAGGTAWGCEMFFARMRGVPVIPLFLFDQGCDKWFQAKPDATWVECVTPSPSSYWIVALIGSRELTSAGRAAINNVFA